LVTKKIILGTSLTTVLGILIYLSTLQGVSITTSGDIKCLGTLDNPCISYFNITSNYYTLKFFNTSNQKLSFSPEVKDYKIYRFTYGKWKEINFPINMTKGVKYQFKIMGYKNNPYQNIKWNIDFGDTMIDPWWNATFTKRSNITISGMGAAARINYPVAVNITYASGMNANFNDLRFLNDTTSVDYWIESNVSSSWAYVWIEIPYIPSSPNVTISMYYGSGDTQTTGNGVATFLFFDDFNDNNLNTTKWLVNTATVEEVRGLLRVGTGADVEGKVPYGYINTSLRDKYNQSGSNIGCNGYYNDTGSTRAFFQYASAGGRIHTYDGALSNTPPYNAMNLATNYWTVFEIWRNNTISAAFYQNDTYAIESFTYIGIGGALVRIISNGLGTEAELDWVLMRNRTYPDAQATLLTEETYTTPKALSIQMPQYVIYPIEDTTTDSNYSTTAWNNNWTMVSGGFKNIPVLANTSKSTWTGTIKSYKPVSYILGGGINTNPTYAYDKGINDTTTYAQSGGDGGAVGAITYIFNMSQNVSSTIFYSFNGTSGGVQLYNFPSAGWDTLGTSGATLNMTFAYLQPVYINSTGSVLLRITSAGVSTGAYTRLWDTYIIYQTAGLTNPPRYGWYKSNITNLPYFDTATLNLYKQPILDNSWGENCNITKPCVVNSYYSLNQTWKGISWNNQPLWINYIIERKNITSNIGSESFNITSNLKSVYSNSTFMLRVPMQDLWLKSINFTKSNYSSNIIAYYRPYIYSSSGNVTNSTYAFDNSYNDTSSYMEAGTGGFIEYWFEVGTNKFNGTLFFTYDYDADGPTQQPIIQAYNSTNTWYNFYGSYYDESGYCYNFVGPLGGNTHTCSFPLLNSTRFKNSTGPLIDSTGLVKMMFVGAGRLYDTYIVINDVSSSPFINASVTKYLLNESSCVSLGNMTCYQNGTFTPKGQTNSQWMFNVTNIGTLNGSVSAYWSQNLPSCMKHYLSINYTLESSVDYDVSSTTAINITSLNTSQSQQFWGFFILNNCTAGYWINSTLVFG